MTAGNSVKLLWAPGEYGIYEVDGGYEVEDYFDVFGPDGPAGRVHMTTSAEQWHLWPGTRDPAHGPFRVACQHLMAKEVRAAYEAGDLHLAAPFEPRCYPIQVDMRAVDDLLASGADLPLLQAPGDKVYLGSVEVSDTYSSWPLTFSELVDDAEGPRLVLEFDGEEGALLTFDIAVITSDTRPRRPTPSLASEEPYWRAVAVLAIEAIEAGFAEKAFCVPDPGCFLKVTPDLSEAVLPSTNPQLLAALAKAHPLEWPA